MIASSKTAADLLTATSRRLAEQGYDIIREPDRAMLPKLLQDYRPDAIAIGREPKLVIEIARERSADAKRVSGLQLALRQLPEWRLHLVLDRASHETEVASVTEAEIAPMLDRAIAVAEVDTRAALLMIWSALEALARLRRPDQFARPQTPGRIVERLAFEGIILPSDASFLRAMAEIRNAFAHGDLKRDAPTNSIVRFAELLRELIANPAFCQEPETVGTE